MGAGLETKNIRLAGLASGGNGRLARNAPGPGGRNAGRGVDSFHPTLMLDTDSLAPISFPTVGGGGRREKGVWVSGEMVTEHTSQVCGQPSSVKTEKGKSTERHTESRGKVKSEELMGQEAVRRRRKRRERPRDARVRIACSGVVRHVLCDTSSSRKIASRKTPKLGEGQA